MEMMTRSWPRTAQTAGAAVIALAGLALMSTPGAALADAAAPKSAADCRAITDFDLRGKCWDALDQQNQQDTQAEKKKAFGFGVGLHAPSISAILPKKEDRVREQQAAKEDVRNLTLTLASVDQTPAGRILLTSTDGAVWEQTDTDAVNGAPEPGDTVQVTKGMFGGYMCQVSQWQSVRCQRDR
jgi:hypothetical protein